MSRSGQHVFDRAAEELRTVQHGFRRRDVVFLGREIVDRHLHLRQIELGVVDRHRAGGQAILEIAIAQIEGMVGRGHPRGVGIPVQQIERRGFLALQIVADHVGPDQVVGAQHVEGHRHLAAFEHACLLHAAFEAGNLIFIDKDQKIAGMSEVHLRGKERRRCHAHAAFLREPCQRRREQRAADAIAHGVDAHFPGDFLDDIHRGDGTFAHVVLEGLAAERLVGIDPRDQEHRDALIDAPLHERLLPVEIENVELVDPRRHDQQRRAQHVFRSGLILDELHDLVLEDHLARSQCNVPADLEIGCRLADLERAVTGFDIFREHGHAAHQIVAVAGQGLPQHFRIGQDEVRRREGVDELLDVELGLLAGVGIEAVRILHKLRGPIRGQQISLHEELKELIALPFRVLEAFVARSRFDDRRGRLAGQTLRGGIQQSEIGFSDLGLNVRGALFVREPVVHHRCEGLDHLSEFAGLVGRLAGLARLQIGGEGAAAVLDRAREICGENFRIEALWSFAIRGFRVCQNLCHRPLPNLTRRAPSASRSSRSSWHSSDACGDLHVLRCGIINASVTLEPHERSLVPKVFVGR